MAAQEETKASDEKYLLGEDYEIFCALPPDMLERNPSQSATANVCKRARLPGGPRAVPNPLKNRPWGDVMRTSAFDMRCNPVNTEGEPWDADEILSPVEDEEGGKFIPDDEAVIVVDKDYLQDGEVFCQRPSVLLSDRAIPVVGAGDSEGRGSRSFVKSSDAFTPRQRRALQTWEPTKRRKRIEAVKCFRQLTDAGHRELIAARVQARECNASIAVAGAHLREENRDLQDELNMLMLIEAVCSSATPASEELVAAILRQSTPSVLHNPSTSRFWAPVVAWARNMAGVTTR